MTPAEHAAHLRVVECERCEKLQRSLAAALLDLDNANVDLVAKRREVTRLKNELSDKLRSDEHYGTAHTIFEYWRSKCSPNARTFSDDRLKNVLARLKDKTADGEPAYGPRYICEAILGAAVDPYVDPKRKAHNDLELICRSGRKLEDFHGRWERYQDRNRREAA